MMPPSQNHTKVTTVLSLDRYLRHFPQTTPPALILGRYATSNLGAVRSLAPHHIPTIVIDTRKQSTFYSRYTTGLQSPDPARSPDKYIAFLLDLGQRLPCKGVLFPTGDTETLLLAKHADDLTAYYHLTSAPYELLDRLINKHTLAKLLDQYHIPHPTTYFIDPKTDLTSVSTALSYPCILKPRYPTQFRLDFPLKVFYASSPEEFRTMVDKAAAKGHDMIAQEIIPGNADAMLGFNAYYDKMGGVHGSFMYQRIREWPLGFGNGCYLRQIQNPHLERMTTSLLKPLDYHGIVDVEFRFDSRDRVLKFIEVNPRLWMQNNFPAHLGYNHAYLAYLDALDLPLPLNRSPEDNTVRWVFGAEDLHSALADLRQGTLSMKDWLYAYHPRNVHATFSWNDPMPWVVAAYRSLVWSCSLAVHRRRNGRDNERLKE